MAEREHVESEIIDWLLGLDQHASETQSSVICDLIEAIRNGEHREQSVVASLPRDVTRLVIAAREVAFGPIADSVRHDPECSKVMDVLVAASEAFASHVPWDDEPKRPTFRDHDEDVKICNNCDAPVAHYHLSNHICA